jgi:K+-sensing histidine kinase KdpD
MPRCSGSGLTADEREPAKHEGDSEGCAIPSDALERIFDRFARADTARTRAAGGAGLGLAIVDAIAKAHGGRCAVTTSSNGSIFALRLPGFRPALATALPAAKEALHTLD